MVKVINASAGTGKTHYLVNLLLGNYDVDEIKQNIKNTVVLSFSNAAVDEMKRRLYKEILEKFTINFNTVDEIKKNLFDIPILRVYTIHSFLLELAKILKYDLGIPGDIELELSDNNSIWKKMCEVVFKVKDVNDIINITGFYNLEYKIKENLKNFIKEKGKILFLISEGFNISQIKKDEKSINFYDKMNDKFPLLSDFCKMIGEKYYLPYMYERGIFEFDGLLKVICDYLLKKRNELAVDGYESWFKERLERENFYFTNLFVDEAQDNDIMQNFFIYSVLPANLNKIIVGDPKQSIYYFRNAVPAQFKKAFDEIRNMYNNKADITLKKSYRIISKRTLEYINMVCSNLKQKFPEIWDYNEEIDALVERDFKNEDEKINFNNLNSDIELHLVMGNFTKKNFLDRLPEIDEFLKENNKKIGILVRNRNNLKSSRIIEKIQEMGYSEKIKYKLSVNIKEEIPEFYYKLLKTFIEIFDIKNTPKTAMRILFTDFGKNVLFNYLIKNNIANIEIIELLRKIKKYLDYMIDIYIKKGIALSLAKILDGTFDKNIWKYYFQTDNDISYDELVRILNFVILKLWIEEVESGSFSVDDAVMILEEMDTPYEWYSAAEALGEEASNESVIEVTTIHSSKGKTYDKVIVIANFKDELRDNPDLRDSKDGKIFKYMTSIEFDEVISDYPIIKIGVFPYLGIEIAKTIRDDGNNIPFWLKTIYNNLKKDIISQNLNLLYVALTRTKKDIILLGNLSENIITNNEIKKTYLLQKAKNDGFNYKLNIFNTDKKLINLSPPFKVSYVRDEIGITIEDNAEDIFDRNERFKTNVLLHHILYKIINEMKSKDDYYELIEKYRDKITTKYSYKINNLKSIDTEFLKRILGNNNIRNEVHIFSVDSEGCLKGSIEILFTDKDGFVNLVEIKVIYDDRKEKMKAIEQFSEKQLNKYEEMIKKICNKEITKNKLII